MLNLFLRNLPLILLYGGSGSYLIRRSSTINWEGLINDIEWPGKDRILKQSIKEKMKGFLGPALKYATTSRDRNLIKTFLASLTSSTFMGGGELDVKFNHKSLKQASMETYCGVDEISRQSSELSRYNLNQKKLACSQRISGSGRKSYAELNPELTSCMLQLFDSGSVSGLSAYPRLITDTLFMEKHSWIDMPRCVSILNQVFGIPLKLSTAYTYTENFRSKTNQVKRHYEGRGINPGISLRKSTRNGQKHPSLNSHYATANVNYTIENVCLSHDCAAVARDNKDLVHTDVEVVQRPSKSWIKISYSNHDWAKDSNRTLAITTIQLISPKQSSVSNDYEYLSQLDGIPICKSKIGGKGISLIKMSYFEKESAFRHLNELLYIIFKHKEHFLKTVN
ncbi:unnamed protein product [Mytilus edulis]|uniref:Uncharacterized protein n=1 Tax=Mytilus edulis TaxID=6550 RepID=A0A8S3VAK0_MYTED|nr:unnamed protein product [Mytilus edulis]